MSSPAAQFLNTFATTPAVPQQPQTVAGYTLGPVVGYGSTGVIRKAVSASGSVVAAKIVVASKQHLREAAIWSLLSHEHILPLFACHHTPTHLYFFTLYCPAGSLLDVLKSLGTPALLQDDAGMIFRQVVRGLRYLHQEALLVHRDIKLENVLVDEMGVCRISDFGLAVSVVDPCACSEDEDALPAHPSPRYHRNSTSTHSLLSLQHHNHQNHFQPGSLPYAAPELLVPRPILRHPNAHSRPHPSQDIWALGVLLYALLSGSLPFFDAFEPRLQLKILNGSYAPLKDIGLGAERILKGCLDKNVHTRWSIAMVDEVAWGVGWGREGDGAGMDDPDRHQLPPQRLRDQPTVIIPPRKKRARSKSVGASVSRSISPLSPSPTYRFPPSPSSVSPSRSPSTSPSPARSPLSPITSESGHGDVEIASSPNGLVDDFDTRTDEDPVGEIRRGRKMRSLPAPPLPRQVASGSHYRCVCPQHQLIEEEDGLSLEYDRPRLT